MIVPPIKFMKDDYTMLKMYGGYDSMMGIFRCEKCNGITNYRPEMHGNKCACKPKKHRKKSTST